MLFIHVVQESYLRYTFIYTYNPNRTSTLLELHSLKHTYNTYIQYIHTYCMYVGSEGRGDSESIGRSSQRHRGTVQRADGGLCRPDRIEPHQPQGRPQILLS